MSEDERIAKLEEKVLGWMGTTTEYRVSLCAKIDKIFDRINQLPCDARCEETKAIRSDVGWLQKIVWATIVLGVPALVSLGVAWGSMGKTVNDHAEKIKVLDSSSDSHEKDIAVLKEKSYGYKGVKVLTEDDLNNQKEKGK